MTDTPSYPAPSGSGPRAAWFSGPGWRLAVLALLILAMCIPLMLISVVIEDRVRHQRKAVGEVSYQWGGPVSLVGPVLVIPVEVERDKQVKDLDGNIRTETYTEQAAPIVLMPEDLNMTVDGQSEIRNRGIFEVPVYTVDLGMRFGFDVARVADVVRARETVLWDKAVLSIAMPRTRSFSGAAVLQAGGRSLDLEPGAAFGHGGGIQAWVGDPRGLDGFELTMGLNGADQLMFSPTGRLTVVELVSDWPHPSFAGAFLPNTRDVTDEGFRARWEIPHLARDIAQVSRTTDFDQNQFGVRFFSPVDIYQQVLRAAKYGILFIALTFLTVFLTERLATRRVHPAQFVLIGIAQCVFFLLLLSFAEQIGFGWSYLAASAATIGLISFYGKTGLGLERRWTVLGASLVGLYGVLYLILRSTDYALLLGSVLAFVAIALVMVLTRGERWTNGGSSDRVSSAPAAT